MSNNIEAADPSGLHAAGSHVPSAEYGKTRGYTSTYTEKGVRIRYALMALHLSLIILITTFTAVFLSDILLFAITLALALAFIIYIPAAFGLSLAKRHGHFDHAGGEIAYLVVQQVGWLVIAIFNALFLSFVTCDARRRAYTYSVNGWSYITSRSTLCQWAGVVLGLSLVHFLLLIGWMIWVIVVVRRASPHRASTGFQVSTPWLLRGWKA